LNSKEVLEQTGISRATLNNYISWGIVPKPDVLPPGPQDGAAPRIGYFPDEVVARIVEIQRLKREGWTMTRIAERFGAPPPPAAASEPETPARPAQAPSRPERGVMPQLSIEEITHPAYMVNHGFEVIWFNAAAEVHVFRRPDRARPEPPPQNVFKYLFASLAEDPQTRERILRFHLSLAKQRRIAISALCADLAPDQARVLEGLNDPNDLPQPGLVSQLSFAGRQAGETQSICLYAIQFREGTLLVQVAGGQPSHELSALLTERERASVDGRRRMPSLSHVAVLATELQHSNRIWSVLPADEYFELINQIWMTVDPILRRNHGTQGKHAGDGMVGYFFPDRDTSYVWNALAAARDIREAMRRLSREWQLRKGWSIELCMNTGVDEGQQWVARPASPGQLDFTMLGDTLNHAARLSDFANDGAIWVTKNLFGKLTFEETRRIKFGIRSRSGEGREVFVPSIFSTLEQLCDPDTGPGEQLKSIARLPITEVLEIAPTDKRTERAVE
jgi:class 3 adenylate cyclase